MPKTNQQKAKYIKEWRKKAYNEKRYNKPLRDYIRLKHPRIFSRYDLFYQTLNEENPTAKDLTKTRQYRAWKKRMINQINDETNDSETKESANPIIETDQHKTVTTEEEQEPSIQPEQNEAAQDDLLSIAVGELPPVNVEINELNDNIDAIIHELEQEQVIRDMLNGEILNPHRREEDEGIDLDIEIELDGIVEPFDYAEEVEPFNF